MTFGEKVKQTRLSLNLSQTELAQLSGITERSLYTYEQLGIIPRPSNVKKLAAALNVSEEYLMNQSVADKTPYIDQDKFIDNVKTQFGSKGAKEAKEILTRTGALLAGGDLDDGAKEVFFQALMEVYLESKKSAQDKFTPKKYRKTKAKS